MSQPQSLSTADGGRTHRSVKVTPLRPAPAYRIEELAQAGPLGRTSLYKAIREGRLIARTAGGTTIILASDWMAFLHACPPTKELA